MRGRREAAKDLATRILVWVTKDKCLLDEEDDEDHEIMSKFRHHKKPSLAILIRMSLL